LAIRDRRRFEGRAVAPEIKLEGELLFQTSGRDDREMNTGNGAGGLVKRRVPENHADAVLPACDDSRGLRIHYPPFLGERACRCGGAGMPARKCDRPEPADPDDVPLDAEGLHPRQELLLTRLRRALPCIKVGINQQEFIDAFARHVLSALGYHTHRRRRPIGSCYCLNFSLPGPIRTALWEGF